MPAELLSGLVVGLIGLVLAALVKGLDWGLFWSLLALAGVLFVTPRWLANSAPSTGVAAISIAVGAAAIGFSFGHYRQDAVWPFVVSLGGAWAAVPDTESISVLLGAALVFALVNRPLSWTRSTWYGGVAAGALSALVALTEAPTRPAAVIGAIGALAVSALWRTQPGAWALHVALVWFWSRVASRSISGIGALTLGLVVTLALVGSFLAWHRFMTKRQGSQR